MNHNHLAEAEHQDDISFYTRQVYLQLQKNYPEYGITDEEIVSVSHLAPIHDIGKIKVPIEILNKNGKLTREEMNVVKQHPLTGAAMTKIPRWRNNGKAETNIAMKYADITMKDMMVQDTRTV